MNGAAATARCGLCGGEGLRFVFAQSYRGRNYRAAHCRACDLHQTIGEVAPVSPDYVDLSDAELTPEHVFLQHAHKHPAFDQWLHHARRLGPLPDHERPPGADRPLLLDIGCGVGGFLDFAAAAGFAVHGFDASGAQAAIARARHPAVRCAISLDDYVAEIAPGVCFDHVTMWDVFEHIREPLVVLDAVRRRLRPGGLLFVSVPSGRPHPVKLLLRRLQNREPGLIPWEHVFYHSPRSLALTMARAGLAVRRQGGVAPYVRTPGLAELARRAVHRALAPTPYALQIYAFAALAEGGSAAPVGGSAAPVGGVVAV